MLPDDRRRVRCKSFEEQVGAAFPTVMPGLSRAGDTISGECALDGRCKKVINPADPPVAAMRPAAVGSQYVEWPAHRIGRDGVRQEVPVEFAAASRRVDAWLSRFEHVAGRSLHSWIPPRSAWGATSEFRSQ